MTIPIQLLVIFPFLVIAAIAGTRRGWQEEAITTVGLLVALLFFGNATRTGLLGQLINRIVSAFGSFFSTLLGTDFQATALFQSDNPAMFQILGYVGLVILAYLVGGALGNRRGITRLGAAMGGFLGVANVFLVASQAFAFINEYFPNAFNTDSTVTIAADNGANVIRDNLPSIFALLFILLLVIVFLRLPKIRN